MKTSTNFRFTKAFFSILMVLAILCTAAVSCLSASAAELDTTRKGTIGVTCTKPGYTFEIFKIATLDNTANTSTSSYDTTYTPLVSQVASAITAGNTESIVSTLDNLATVPNTAVSAGTWTSSASSTSHTFNNLDQGIFYIRATNYPAGVKSVTGSVIALPYYNGTNWVYDYSGVNLAAKVLDESATTEKTITNSTKNNVNYTDVSLGDTVNFNIKSKTAGSSEMKLKTYTVYDDMSAGLTLNKNSFVVSLLNASGTKVADVASSNYTVNVTSEAKGEATAFNIAFKYDYLQTEAFYAENVAYTSISYTADLNEYAVAGTAGNPNTDTKLSFSNKNDVVSEVEGNTVYVYTYGVKVLKKDENGDNLEGATFKIYPTENDAKNDTNSIATATSGNNGIALFKNGDNQEMKFQSGTYYIVETAAPSGYNVYGKVITVTIDATYGGTLTNGTYVTNSPSDGYAEVSVTDTKLVLPKTGGIGNTIFYVIAGVGFVIGVSIFVISRKKSKADKK